MQRKKFNRVDAERAQVGNFFNKSEISAGMAHAGGRVGGESFQVRFVNDQFFKGDIGRAVVLSVKRAVHDNRFGNQRQIFAAIHGRARV